MTDLGDDHHAETLWSKGLPDSAPDHRRLHYLSSNWGERPRLFLIRPTVLRAIICLHPLSVLLVRSLIRRPLAVATSEERYPDTGGEWLG